MAINTWIVEDVFTLTYTKDKGLKKMAINT